MTLLNEELDFHISKKFLLHCQLTIRSIDDRPAKRNQAWIACWKAYLVHRGGSQRTNGSSDSG